MKQVQTKFTCDMCGKEETEMDFPYFKNWVYLYKLDFKLSPDRLFHLQDKHFCSEKCMKAFISKNISDAMMGFLEKSSPSELRSETAINTGGKGK